jgi:hypothetical protein
MTSALTPTPTPRRDGGKGREEKGEERRGEEKVRRNTRGRSRNPVTGRCPPAIEAIAICTTSDLLLKHPDENTCNILL